MTKTTAETDSAVTLELSSEQTLSYVPGQFLTIYLPELATPEGKAYSIASAPHEPLRITVSARGEFSRHLCAMHVGDTLHASDPSGYFYSESKSSTLIMLAAGIGIAPFRSIILDALRNEPTRRLMLFYTNRTIADVVFRDELDALAATHPNFTVHHFITREDLLPAGITRGRMSAEAIIREVGDAADPEYFMCGSIEFVRDFWRGLKAAGIAEDRLYTEAFFGH